MFFMAVSACCDDIILTTRFLRRLFVLVWRSFGQATTTHSEEESIVMQDPGELERTLIGHSPKLQAILEAARRRFRAGKGISHDEFWKEVETDSAKPARTRNRKNGRSKR
jgi:hypothetical protein